MAVGGHDLGIADLEGGDTLFSEPGGTMPGWGFSGLSLKRIIMSTLAPIAPL